MELLLNLHQKQTFIRCSWFATQIHYKPCGGLAEPNGNSLLGVWRYVIGIGLRSGMWLSSLHLGMGKRSTNNWNVVDLSESNERPMNKGQCFLALRNDVRTIEHQKPKYTWMLFLSKEYESDEYVYFFVICFGLPSSCISLALVVGWFVCL